MFHTACVLFECNKLIKHVINIFVTRYCAADSIICTRQWCTFSVETLLCTTSRSFIILPTTDLVFLVVVIHYVSNWNKAQRAQGRREDFSYCLDDRTEPDCLAWSGREAACILSYLKPNLLQMTNSQDNVKLWKVKFLRTQGLFWEFFASQQCPSPALPIVPR